MNYNGAMNFKCGRCCSLFFRWGDDWSLFSFLRLIKMCARGSTRTGNAAKCTKHSTGLTIIIVLLMLFFFFQLPEFSFSAVWRHKQGMLWIAQYCFWNNNKFAGKRMEFHLKREGFWSDANNGIPSRFS